MSCYFQNLIKILLLYLLSDSVDFLAQSSILEVDNEYQVK